ncbi:DNA repair protein RecN [Solicola gregarius]|uniref:DNA repair protein RecN n=1 Tax=Solicola gregarius TaxID=2908642 RepID=A0AA46THF3_9ACTN|nr:DNA repair protein RecN [Solicola gregarius]UYM05195.1 DNA repair protein RecN [Solicola gregarius]
MWEEIRLSSLGVIDEAALDLDPGLTVITGETGAGKTMVVSALNLLRGRRAESTLVRQGAKRSRVEARLDTSAIEGIADAALEAGGEVEEGSLIVGRTVSAEGRSRAFVGGASVPASVLGAISERAVAVHGQSDQNRLLRTDAQRGALDQFAGAAVADLLTEFTPAYERLRAVEREIAELTTNAQERARELDLLRFGLTEIDEVAPEAGELDALVAEEDRLANAEALVTSAHAAHVRLTGDAESAEPGADAAGLVAGAQSALDAAAGHDTELERLASRVAEIGYLIADTSAELGAYADSVEADPVRLDGVQSRRAAITALLRKYGTTVDDVLGWADDARKRSGELDGDDDRIDGLSTERDELTARLLDLGVRLRAARGEAAERLTKLVDAELTELAMPHAHVEVSVDGPGEPSAADLTPHGLDSVEIGFAANRGSPALPLNKGASGGELSRVMLALEVVLADTSTVPTLVFDEVDAGIGGKAAVEVGRRLARLARSAQVIAVTHLPQVAAFADRHYRVVKSDDGTVTTSGISMLDADARVEELSRMLAGLEGSATAEAHARELLDLATQTRH